MRSLYMEMVQKEVVKGGKRREKGPWVVHRTMKDGRVVTRHRFPSDKERQRNRERERNRRFVARKIFSGLRAFGNYKLSKNADTIDLLKALCEEAGWQVEADGTIYKKKLACEGGGCYNNDEYYVEAIESRTVLPEMTEKNHNIDLKLSLSLASH